MGKDQVESYAARKGMKVSEVEHGSSPILGYDPAKKSSLQSRLRSSRNNLFHGIPAKRLRDPISPFRTMTRK
jgi:hypothetical protein